MNELVGSVVADLGRRLTAWIPDQRWFLDAGASEVTTIVPEQMTPLHERFPLLLWCPTSIRYSDGTDLLCQVMVGVDAPDAVPDDALVIGAVGEDDALVAYEAFGDRRLRDSLAQAAGVNEWFRRTSHAAVEGVGDVIRIDTRRQLTLFRWLERGPNPDIEIPLALARAGTTGAVSAPATVWIRDGLELGVIGPQLRGTRFDELVAASLDEVIGKRQLPEQCSVDVADPARAIGRALAELHAGLGEAFGSVPLEAHALVAALESNADVLEAAGIGAEALRSSAQRAAGATDLGSACRTHGAVGLATFRLRRGAVTIDGFQGDPTVPLEHRRSVTSPLRDLARLLGELNEFAAARVPPLPTDPDEVPEGLEAVEVSEPVRLAEAWLERAETSLLAGYGEVAGAAELLPGSSSSRDALLRYFELERTVERLVLGQEVPPTVVDLSEAAVRVVPQTP